ncbi:MAG: methyltransferase, partial [Acidimicrobiales bacterium]|nr:methyltransferase [Acidimicrobiales bacterium]
MSRREPTEVMEVPQGRFALSRWPDRQGSPLRAWDAADEYLLSHLRQEAVPLHGTVLIVNDAFGALGTALSTEADISWGDSVVSHRALAANLGRTNLAGPVALPGNKTPAGTIDVLLLKVPKHNSLLEDQLHRLRPLLLPDSRVIVAGMSKNIHTSTLGLLEKILGPTRTSLAKKKARLAFTRFDPDIRPDPNPWPITWHHDGLTVVNHGGVFSARSIDIGTRFLLHHLP